MPTCLKQLPAFIQPSLMTDASTLQAQLERREEAALDSSVKCGLRPAARSGSKPENA